MLTLRVHSLDETLFIGPAVSVTAPGREGEMTVYDNHMALLTTLAPGTLTVRPGAKPGETSAEHKQFEVMSGILEIRPRGHVTILVQDKSDTKK